MDEQFANTSGSRLLAEVGAVFKTKRIFQNRSRHVIFVCGGKIDGPTPTMRSQFINWARTELPDFILVLAETAFREALFHDPPKFINLSKFERLVAQISDCVLIFPESAGSFAEIGCFSTLSTVRKKVLVANDLSHQAADSFTNLGPIDTINRNSFLRPAIHISTTDPHIDFFPVKERLSRLRDRVRRKRLHHGPYAAFDYGEKFCVLLETVIIFRALTLEGLKKSIAESFGSTVKQAVGKDLQILLSTLVASGYVARRDEYFVATAMAAPLLEIEGTSLDDLVARTTYYHQRHDRRAYELVRGL
jgi:hypothetical protein